MLRWRRWWSERAFCTLGAYFDLSECRRAADRVPIQPRASKLAGHRFVEGYNKFGLRRIRKLDAIYCACMWDCFGCVFYSQHAAWRIKRGFGEAIYFYTSFVLCAKRRIFWELAQSVFASCTLFAHFTTRSLFLGKNLMCSFLKNIGFDIL